MTGEPYVGKTSLMNHLVYKNFNHTLPLGIGANFTMYPITVDEIEIRLQIWDTYGHQEVRNIRRVYYYGALGSLVLFDITDRESFEKIGEWVEALRNYSNNAEMIIIGNKKDLEEIRSVDYAEAEEYAQRNGLIYLETSAKTGDNVDMAFATLTKLILEKVSNL